jgi:hypothetical protein
MSTPSPEFKEKESFWTVAVNSSAIFQPVILSTFLICSCVLTEPNFPLICSGIGNAIAFYLLLGWCMIPLWVEFYRKYIVKNPFNVNSVLSKWTVYSLAGMIPLLLPLLFLVILVTIEEGRLDYTFFIQLLFATFFSSFIGVGFGLDAADQLFRSKQNDSKKTISGKKVKFGYRLMMVLGLVSFLTFTGTEYGSYLLRTPNHYHGKKALAQFSRLSREDFKKIKNLYHYSAIGHFLASGDPGYHYLRCDADQEVLDKIIQSSGFKPVIPEVKEFSYRNSQSFPDYLKWWEEDDTKNDEIYEGKNGKIWVDRKRTRMFIWFVDR